MLHYTASFLYDVSKKLTSFASAVFDFINSSSSSRLLTREKSHCIIVELLAIMTKIYRLSKNKYIYIYEIL